MAEATNPIATASNPRVGGFSFEQPQRSRMYDVLRRLGQAAIRSQKITDHETASASQNECLRDIEALVTEALSESNLDLRVDAQVWTTARELTEEQRAQPDWLWHAGGKAASCYGRWPKGNPHMAPYVRADIALGIRAALASAPSPEAGAGGDLGELERLSTRATSGEWSAEEAGRITAAGTSPGYDIPVWGTILTAHDTQDVEDGVTHWSTDGSRQGNTRFAAACVNYVRKLLALRTLQAGGEVR